MNSVSLRQTKNFITNADFKNPSAVKIAVPNVEENEGVAVGLAADDPGIVKTLLDTPFFSCRGAIRQASLRFVDLGMLFHLRFN